MHTDSLFVGQTYIDITMMADEFPKGDQKAVAHDFAVSFGGNAVTAAFACAKLGGSPALLTSLADDWLGHMFLDMAQTYHIPLHRRDVSRSSLSVILPKDGKRAILRARDDQYLTPIPSLDLTPFRALHLDGHQKDAALFYAKAFKERSCLTSLDGGSLRENTHDLLAFIDVAIVAVRLCEQMQLSSPEMLSYLKERGVKIGGVTEGEKGMLWYDETGNVQRLPALHLPSTLIVDTSGAGDVFHGAYMYSYLQQPTRPFREHFTFARAASAYKIQHVGNEAGLPTLEDVQHIRQKWEKEAHQEEISTLSISL